MIITVIIGQLSPTESEECTRNENSFIRKQNKNELRDEWVDGYLYITYEFKQNVDFFLFHNTAIVSVLKNLYIFIVKNQNTLLICFLRKY